MSSVSTCFWFDNNAKQAVDFYAAIFGDDLVIHETANKTESNLDKTQGSTEDVLTVCFEIKGHQILALNGGPGHPLTDAASLQILCDTQEELDRYWEGLTSQGGHEVMCGWVTDQFGLSWQITPTRLPELLADPDREKADRVMREMMTQVKLDLTALERAAANA